MDERPVERQRYRNADAREVGSKLSVATVLEGTVRRSGSRLRVTARLVNASDGLVRWSDRYERESKDVFEVQDDITGDMPFGTGKGTRAAALLGSIGHLNEHDGNLVTCFRIKGMVPPS